jgi:hypothetical protein
MSRSINIPQKQSSNPELNELFPNLEKLSLGPRSPIMPNVVNSPGTFQDKRKRLRRQIKGMVQNLEKECYRIIFDIFPEKIKLLDEMYKSRKEFNLNKNEVKQELPKPSDLICEKKDDQERKTAQTVISANKALTDLVEVLQKEILEMSEMINALSIWVKLNVPRIADGNNFGVEVQEEITKVLESAEDAGYDVLDSFATYHSTRGTILVNVLAHPNIIDFRHALQELDEKTYIKTCLLANELRNDYITLYDLLAKNMDTLITPRSGEDEKLARMY